jgi:hypothetical protein
VIGPDGEAEVTPTYALVLDAYPLGHDPLRHACTSGRAEARQVGLDGGGADGRLGRGGAPKSIA